MPRFIHNIIYHIVYAAAYALSLLPMRVLLALADALYVVLRYIVRYRRRTVKRNIASAMPALRKHNTTGPAPDAAKIEKAFYHWLADYFVETIKLLSISEKEMRRRMTFSGTEEIDRLTAQGISCALLLGHFCNWEWVSTLPLHINRQGIFAGELYHRLRNKTADRLFLALRQRFYTTCVDKDEAMRTLLHYYRNGTPSVVGYIADQKPKWQNIHLWVNFLAHDDTPVFTGTERIIRAIHAAFFYLDMQRTGRARYHCRFRLIETDSAVMPRFRLTQTYMQMLEQSIARQPECYLWSHDRWSRTKEEFERRFYVKNGKVRERQQPS